MLTQERFDEIVRLVNRDGAVTVQELAQELATSESTIRRDLLQLDKLGRLNRVHGGATAATQIELPRERDMQEKYSRNIEAKRQIAAYAAKLIKPHDLVFLDAGSTTVQLADFLEEQQAVYVTNGITLAQRLAARGFKTMLIAGRVKATTDAVIGSEAAASLENYHFTKGFFGANGITLQAGFTTPDVEEARNKRAAMEHCRSCYVLADTSKFDVLSNVTFGSLKQAVVITAGTANPGIKKYKQHLEVIEL